MTDREKEIVTIIAEALPKMSEFEKGYLLGIAEGKAGNGKNGDKDCPAAQVGLENNRTALAFYLNSIYVAAIDNRKGVLL